MESETVGLNVENIHDFTAAVGTIDENTTGVHLWGKNCPCDLMHTFVTALNTHPFISTLLIYIDNLEKSSILLQALKLNTSITFVGIKKISDDVIVELADVIHVNSTIERITFLEQPDDEVADMRPLFNASDSRSCNVNFRPSHPMDGVTNALVNNTTLLDLDIDGNEIGLDGMIALSNALCLNTSLSALHVGKKKHDGLVELMHALGMNATITNFSIVCDMFGKNQSSYVRAIAKMVCINTSIQHIQVICRKLTESEMQLLIDSFIVNSTVTYLGMPSYQQSVMPSYQQRSVLQNWISILESNSALCDFEFNHDDDDEEVLHRWGPIPSGADLALVRAVKNRLQSTASVQCILSEYLTQ